MDGAGFEASSLAARRALVTWLSDAGVGEGEGEGEGDGVGDGLGLGDGVGAGVGVGVGEGEATGVGLALGAGVGVGSGSVLDSSAKLSNETVPGEMTGEKVPATSSTREAVIEICRCTVLRIVQVIPSELVSN